MEEDAAEVEVLDRDGEESGGIATTNSSLIAAEGEAVSSTCNQFPPKRNRHAGSQPARAYMIAHADWKTQLESFKSTADVKWDSWWSSFVTRVELDSRGHEVRRKCNCGTCDQYFNWAKRRLFTVTSCKSPSGKWVQAFSVYQSSADHNYTFATWTGRQFERQETATESFGLDVGVAKGPFTASASYSHVVQTQATNTWSAGTNTSHSWFVRRGDSAVVWKYQLSSKCYNVVNMHLEDLTFGTNIFHGTPDSRRPTCNPNRPGSCK